MEKPIQSDGRWYRIEPEVLEIPLALPIYNNFESYQKNIRHPKVMGSKKISPKSNELEESKLNYITEKKEPFFKKNQNKITVFFFSCFFAWILILTIMAVIFGIFYRIPNSIHFFLTNTPTTDNLDQCLRTANSEMFWNGEKCESAFGFGSKCSKHEQCQIITQYTFCIDQTCKCKDETREYFNGIRCVPKNYYLEQCTEPQQCLDSESTFCNSTHCVCQETEYFSINKCVSRLGELEMCYFTEMCLNDMVCNGTNCMCLGNKFYDNTTNKCTDQKIFNNYCDKDLECRSDLGLVCTGNRCICGSSSHTWSNIRQECLLTYSKRFCLTNDACNPDQNLKCIYNDCNCPIVSVDGMCDCSRAEGSEEFWDGSVCSSAKTYAEYCSNDFECQTKTQNTLCIAGFCVCSNYSIEFWNGNKCQSKKRHLETCNQKSECLDSDITDCIDDICSCPTGQYYNEVFSKCVARLGEFEACVNDTMCLEVMTCHSVNKYCLCNTDEYFESITSECRIKKSINIWCDNDWQCSNLKGLTCQSNRCLCALNTHSWDSSNQECRLTYSTLSCSSDDDCNTSENLTCTDFTNRCNCPSNETFKICDCSNSVDKYWNGSSCVDGKSYGLSCNFSFECKVKQEKLTCRDNKCQCEENEKFEYNECIEKCPIGTQIFDDRCLDFSTIAEVNLDGQVGSFCNIDSDCSGQLLLPDGSIISTTRCTDHKCECNEPKYTVIGYSPEYRCHIHNGAIYECIDDLECELICNLSNNRCSGDSG